jgi:hemoglobin
VILRLVERFYHHMDTWPGAAAIRAMHPLDLTIIKHVLERYLVQWMGGPALYSAERGHPRLRRRHLSFPIGSAEREAWMYCMRQALAEVVADEPLRTELESAFSKLADFMRNRPEPASEHPAPSGPRE